MAKRAQKKKSYDKPIPSPLTPSTNDLYYDAMELLESNILEHTFQALILLNEAYLQGHDKVEIHIGFVHAYGSLEIEASVDAHINVAYAETCSVFPKWPKRLEWEFVENRPYLRAIHYKADRLCDHGENDEAIKLYKLLLTLNPNDNQGIRYLVAGHYAGLTGDDVNALFDEGNEKQNWNKLHKLLETQNKKHNFWK